MADSSQKVVENAKTITRRRGACDTCRRRKVRCDGCNPCGSCKKVRLSCQYPIVRSTTPFSSSQASSAAVNVSQYPDSTDPGCISLETLTDFDENQGSATWNLSPWDMSSTYSSAGDLDMKSYMEAKWPSFTEIPRGVPTESQALDFGVFADNEVSNDNESPSAFFSHFQTLTTSSSLPIFPTEYSAISLSRRTGHSDEHMDFLDNISNETPLDFSACHLFGLPKMISKIIRDTDSSQLIKVSQILKHGKAHQDTQQELNNSTSEDNGWYLDERGSTQRILDSCFQEFYELEAFITRPMVLKHIDISRVSPGSEILSHVFSRAVLTLGYYTCLPRHKSTIARKTVDRYLRAALLGYESIQALPSSLFKLQTTLVLIIIADMVDERLMPNLITHAAHFARSISQPSIYEFKTLKKSLDQFQLAGCLRLLHTIESFHATCNGLLPMLNPAAIGDIKGSLDGNQWQQAECAATSTLAMIFERLYGSNALQESAACRKVDIQACDALLNKWRLSLPQPFDKIHEEWSEDFYKPRLWRAAQRLMVRYYSGVFLIFCPWLSVTQSSRTSHLLDAECLARCRSQCFKAACSFLLMADHVSRYNIALEGMFFDLLTISLYLVVWGTVSGGLEEKRECMSCLCIAYGILGRMFLFQGEIPHGVFTLLKQAISKFEERLE